MQLSDHDRKLLWAKAGNRCSYRNESEVCNELLVIDNNGTWTITGQECHIVGEKRHAARYKEDFPTRETYSNAILMCGKHHKVIDDNETTYPIELLHTMKSDHEKAIAAATEKGEIAPLLIQDAKFLTIVEEAQRAIGMDVNRPAQLSNVESVLIVGKAQEAVGFSTNQSFTGMVTSCDYCNKLFPVAFTGNPPRSVKCPHCRREKQLRQK